MDEKDMKDAKVNEAVHVAINACLNVVSAKSDGFSPTGRVFINAEGRALGLVQFGCSVGIKHVRTGDVIEVPVRIVVAVGDHQTQHLQLTLETANEAAQIVHALFEGEDGGEDAGDEALIQEARRHQA